MKLVKHFLSLFLKNVTNGVACLFLAEYNQSFPDIPNEAVHTISSINVSKSRAIRSPEKLRMEETKLPYHFKSFKFLSLLNFSVKKSCMVSGGHLDDVTRLQGLTIILAGGLDLAAIFALCDVTGLMVRVRTCVSGRPRYFIPTHWLSS